MASEAAIEWERANPAAARALDDAGYRMTGVTVVKMLDDDTSAKWWARRHEVLGEVLHPFDGPVPANSQELLAFVSAHFGPDAYALF